MGYESRLYVVIKNDWGFGENKNGKTLNYAETIAEFNLCKVYPVSDKMRRYPDTDVYIISDDGNTAIFEDMYGSPLKEIPIKDAISILGQAMENDGYRRYKPCYEMLKALDESMGEGGNLVVLHYGY